MWHRCRGRQASEWGDRPQLSGLLVRCAHCCCACAPGRGVHLEPPAQSCAELQRLLQTLALNPWWPETGLASSAVPDALPHCSHLLAPAAVTPRAAGTGLCPVVTPAATGRCQPDKCAQQRRQMLPVHPPLRSQRLWCPSQLLSRLVSQWAHCCSLQALAGHHRPRVPSRLAVGLTVTGPPSSGCLRGGPPWLAWRAAAAEPRAQLQPCRVAGHTGLDA